MKRLPGKDPLCDYLAKAEHNAWASVTNFPVEYERLRDIDLAFRKILVNLDNLRDEQQIAAMFFFYRAHSCFLAGTRLALSGQVYDTFVIARACLEAAAYGVTVAEDRSAADLWVDRNAGDEALKAMKERFKHTKVLALLLGLAPVLAGIFNELYGITIDLGAHPNPRGVLGGSELAMTEGGIRIDHVYFWDDSPPLHAGLRIAAQTGVTALRLCGLVYPERFTILGLQEETERLARGLEVRPAGP